MIFSGKLRHVVTVQQKSSSRAANGEQIVSWTTFATRNAEVQPLRGREYVSLRAAQSDITIRVRMRYLAGLNDKMRVLWEANPYPIVEVIDVDGRHKELELLCSGASQDA